MGETSLDLTTILITALVAALAGLFGATISLRLALPGILAVAGSFFDGKLTETVERVSNDDEFRNKIAEPVIQDAMGLILANKQMIVSEFVAEIQKQLGSNGGGDIKLGGIKIPAAAVGMISGLLGGNLKNAAAQGLGGALLG